jgi:sugar diacid utilization regulator
VPAIYLANSSDPVARLIDTLSSYKDEVVEQGLHRIRTEVSEYGQIDEPRFVDDVREHVGFHHEGLLRSLAAGHPLDRAELGFIRPHATRRVGRIPLAAFMQAFRIYTEELWEAVLREAGDDAARATALESASTVIRYMNVAAAEAAEVYLDAERLLHADGERVRRDLLEDLIAGRQPASGPKITAAREAGIDSPTACVVIAAVSASPEGEGAELRSAAIALARAIQCGVHPLTVVRSNEIVIVAPLRREVEELVDALECTQEALAVERIPLAIGVSTVQRDLERIGDAYDEAATALEHVRSSGGVVALPRLSTFECLTLFGRETARRRITPGIKEFVAQDVAGGRVLTSTLLEYVAADLNTRVAAERLSVHPNTARYRLGKIEERTDCDLRRVADLLDLLIAVQVHDARPER